MGLQAAPSYSRRAMSAPEHEVEERGTAEGGADATSVQRLGRDAIVYGVGFIAQRAAGLIMLPIYTRYLIPEDYATLHLLQMSLDVAEILLAAGLTAGILRFATKTDDPREERAVFVAAWGMATIFNLLGALALFASADWIARAVLENPAYDVLVMIAATSFLLEPALFVPTVLMQHHQRSMLYTVISVARLVLQLTLNIVFVVGLEWGVRGIVISTLATYLVLGAPLMIYLLRWSGFPLSRTAAWDLLRYGLPYRITEAGQFVLTYADRYFLVAAQGLAVTGVYSLAYQFGFVLVYLGPVPFFLAWDPQRFRLARAPREERDPLYDTGFLFLSVVVVSLAVGLSLFVTPTLEVMSDPAYHAAAGLVPLIVLAYVTNAWSRAFELGIQVAEETLWATWATWIAVGIIVLLYWLLIPPLGAWGAAIATVVAFSVRMALLLIFAQRLWPVRYIWAPHLRLAVYGIAAVVPYFLVRPEALVAQLGLATGLFALYALAVWYGGVLDAERRGAALAWLRRHVRLLRRAEP